MWSACVYFLLTRVLAVWLGYKALDKALRLIRYASPRSQHAKRKNILVTGCDTGFGNIFAKRMCKKGHRVFAGCLTEKGVKKLRNECNDSNMRSFRLDVSDVDSVKQGYEFVSDDLQKLGEQPTKLWGLVNNAGIVGVSAPMSWLDPDDFDSVYKVNVIGQINVIKAFLPMLKRNKGRIVNTASIVGRLAIGGSAPYVMSKYGVEAMSDCLRHELRYFGVTVHIIEPGFYNTNISDTKLIVSRMHAKYQSLPQDDQDEYGSDFVDQVESRINGVKPYVFSNRLHMVPDAYEHALTAVFPRARYLVGWDARTMYWIMSYLPEWVNTYLMVDLAGNPKPKACH